MPAPAFSAERDAAIEAARAAGTLIRYHAGQAPNVREKGLHDLVTQADEEAQRIILERLQQAFPDYDVLAEEGATEEDIRAHRRRTDRPRWIVDPIDGTTNFMHDLPPYCVSIALQAEGELVLGVVYEVARDELFVAVRGGGLTLNGAPARVSATEALGQSLVTTGLPFREFWYHREYLQTLGAFMQRTRGIRRPGSAAVDLAYVACGRFDGYFEAGISPWDVAAGIVLVREGGGRVTGLVEGMDPLFSRQILASNGRLHAAMQDVAEPLGRAHAAGEPAAQRDGEKIAR